ncbi:uncharacterized protein LOC132203106 isoform X2 [Neocloeon triangulifer]|uniref:uncharacterized protein LOC132203106 isoform X2 n=1 Tax=Neocloeon triangulifer TaxID=2078957 RepID=UPI00286F6D79|nr:uncharacterized protein LOC132203106 isoform X2 [Neocloeon triangulifer]
MMGSQDVVEVFEYDNRIFESLFNTLNEPSTSSEKGSSRKTRSGLRTRASQKTYDESKAAAQTCDLDEGPGRNKVVPNVPVFNLAEYISSRTFCDAPHHTFSKINRSTTGPELNILEESQILEIGDFMNLFSKFPLSSDVPIPILKPMTCTPQLVLRGGDPSFDLLKKKKAAVRKFSFLKPYIGVKDFYEKGAKMTLDLLKKEKGCPKKCVKIPSEIANLAEAVQMDPDPSFCAEYNWYFTGGALSLSSVAGRKIIFLPGGNDLSDLVAVPMKRRKNSPTGFSVQDDSKINEVSEEGQIFEIKSLEVGDQVLTVRRKKNCQFYTCDRENGLSFSKLHECPALGTDVFTSVELNPWTPSEYMASTRLRAVNIFDVNTGKEKSVLVPKKSWIEDMLKIKDIDNWAQYGRLFQWNKAFFSLDSQDTILFADESAVVSLDRRNETEETVMLDIRNNPSLVNDLMPCEAITYSCSSVVDSNMLYVATTHNLFSLDRRKPNWPVQIWSHCLSSPPVFVSQSCFAENGELILLASSWQKEIVGITNEWKSAGMEPISRAQPLLLPSSVHTLLEANKQFLCLQPSLKNRMQSSRIGLYCTDSSKPSIFTINSCGDVFFQRLTSIDCDKQEDSGYFKSSVESWAKSVQKLDLEARDRNFKGHVTVDPSNLVKNVLCSDKPVPKEAPSIVESTVPNVKPELPFMLKQYDLFEGEENALSSKILESWCIQSPEDWEAKKIAALGGEVESSTKLDRVEAWLATNPRENPETQFGSSQDSQPLTQDLVENSQPTVEIGQEAATDKDVLKSKLFSKYSIVGKKKKRHDGF